MPPGKNKHDEEEPAMEKRRKKSQEPTEPAPKDPDADMTDGEMEDVNEEEEEGGIRIGM